MIDSNQRAIDVDEQARRTTTLALKYTATSARPYTRLGARLNPDPRRLLTIVSVTLLVAWVVWWGLSLARHELIGVHRCWFPGFFGCDFLFSVDQPTRVWLAGGDPYDEHQQPLFFYPPPVLRMFAWCGLFSPQQSLAVWIGGMTLICCAGAYASWRSRRRLGLHDIPLPTVLVAVLFSTPVVFSMERGNYDLVTVPLVIAALALSRVKSRYAQIAAGAILALAPWAKLYPGLLGVGLIGLRRWTTLSSFVIFGLLIGAANLEQVQKFRTNADQTMTHWANLSRNHPELPVPPWNHSLYESWPRIWKYTPLSFLSRIDGRVAAIAILGPLLAWVSYHLFRCPQRDRLAFPYLMWVVALATFVPLIANDYSLVFLPLAALAVCDRRDPLLVKLAMAALFLWWQPLALPINGRLLILIKLAGLAAVGVCLAERCCAAASSIGKNRNDDVNQLSSRELAA